MPGISREDPSPGKSRVVGLNMLRIAMAWVRCDATLVGRQQKRASASALCVHPAPTLACALMLLPQSQERKDPPQLAARAMPPVAAEALLQREVA